MRHYLALLFIGLLSFAGTAQELKVNVTVNSPQLQLVDPSVFKTLEGDLQEWLTNQKWTNDLYEQDERIEVNFALTITSELSANSFEAELSINSTRPVYGSNYNTILMNHYDKDISFEYEQFQPLQYSQGQYNGNLVSALTFYSYIIIGMDYDSFSPFGGEPYYQLAQEIINTVPQGVANQSNSGWKSTDNKNRYWIVENLLSPRVRPYRQAMYDYHRQSLDIMAADVSAAQKILLDAMTKISDVNRSYPNSMILQMFSNAKRDELVEIFKGFNPADKNKFIQIMSKIDPSNASTYRTVR